LLQHGKGFRLRCEEVDHGLRFNGRDLAVCDRQQHGIDAFRDVAEFPNWIESD
jgi:hypothetical protein